jgi:hypothetical protein
VECLSAAACPLLLLLLLPLPLHRAKTISEWQAWSMCAQQRRWSLVVINPAIVVGPPLAANRQSEAVMSTKYLFDAHLPFAIPIGERAPQVARECLEWLSTCVRGEASARTTPQTCV